jgi:hypothetical protein
MRATNAQELLFQRIREMIPPDISLVDAISESLRVSSDSAYRRIRGETPLVLDEVNALCDQYRLSMDVVLQLNSHHTLFRNIHVSRDEYNYETYLTDLVKQVKTIGGFLYKDITYLTKDLPIFHNFYFEPLVAFRYFFWMKTLMRHPDFKNRDYDAGCVPAGIHELSRELVIEYCRIPSTEIWNTECINTAIMQVEFYRDSGYFSSASEARIIYDALEETLVHVKKQVEKGCKFMPGSATMGARFNFFYNRVILGDNTVLVTTDHQKSVFLNYNVLNYITTNDISFCEQCSQDIQNIQKGSTMISQTSEKQRNIFFEILLAKISERKKQL